MSYNRKEEELRPRDTGVSHIEMEVEAGKMQVQAKEGLGFLEPPEARKEA